MSRQLGGSVALLEPSSAATNQAALADALAGATHVLYAPPTVSDSLAVEAAYDLFNAARRLSTTMAALALPPRLFVLTRNDQPVFDGDRSDPAHAVLWGLGRTLALEHPEMWGGIVDVDASVSAGLAARYVLAEACGVDGEDQVLYRAGARRVPRLKPAHPQSAAPVEFDHHGSHLVIGATGNIGPQLIAQLADMGAGTIVAVSRNPGTRLDDLAARLSDQATKLVTVAADASDTASMAGLFERFGTDLPPLHGIYLAAFGGGPVTMRDMTDADVSAMFTPKLDALAVLHNLSLDHPVRQFVVFSSISGLTGSRWLAHYAATTTYLDTFAFARRAAGLPANTINWGLWKSLSDNQSVQERQVTLDSGLRPMPDDVAIQALSLVTGSIAPVRSVVVAADWPQLAAAYRTRAALRILDDMVAGDAGVGVESSSGTAFRVALREADPSQRRDLLVDHVRAAVASAMGLASPHSVDVDAGFFQSGMDSLMSVTLQRGLAESLGEALSASLVFDYPSVDALAGYLASILPELIEVAESESVDEYDDLTDDELLAQLSERLS
jgi:phthiocerol/phenolphthiocerol synthesis type-I polyketide synthase B